MSDIKAIQYCVVDLSSLKVICYCYYKSEALKIIEGLNKVYNIDPELEINTSGYHKFIIEDFSSFCNNTKFKMIQQFIEGFIQE